ncbi:PWI domain-containing protein [Hirsutella rhossiliensis]
MASKVDARLLKSTKFPSEFNQKVDTEKVNLPVMKKWIAKRICEILGSEDDVLIELCCNLIEGSRYPDIKSVQIQITGFLDKDTAPFCKDLWNLLLSAQSSSQGVPKELLEAKKLELMQGKKENAETRDKLEIPGTHRDGEEIVPLAIEIEAGLVARCSGRLLPCLEDAERVTRTAATATFPSQDGDAIKCCDAAVIGLHLIPRLGPARAAGARPEAARIRRLPQDAGPHQLDPNIPEREAGLPVPILSISDVATMLAIGATRVEIHAPALPIPRQLRSEDDVLDREARRWNGIDETLPHCLAPSITEETVAAVVTAAASVAASVIASVAAAAAAAAPAGTRLATVEGTQWQRGVERDVIAAHLEITLTISVDEDVTEVDAEEVVDSEAAEETLLAGGVTVHPSFHSHPFLAKPLMFWKMNLNKKPLQNENLLEEN